MYAIYFATFSSYPTPNFFEKDTVTQNKILATLSKSLRYIYEDLDDESCAKMIRDCLIIVVCCNPTWDCEDPRFSAVLKSWIIAFKLDDLIDDGDFVAGHGFNVNATGSYLKKVDTIEDLTDPTGEDLRKLVLAYPTDQDLIRILFEAKDELKRVCPAFRRGNREHFTQAALLTLQSCALFSVDMNSPETTFTEAGLQSVRNKNVGLSMLMEEAACCDGVSVSSKLRDTLLFRILTDAFEKCSSRYNDTLGLVKDIKNSQTKDTCILRRVVNEGISLEESLNLAFTSLNESIHDFKVAARLLRQAVPEDEQLDGFIRIMECHLDGQIYAFKNVKRYGEFQTKFCKSD